MKGCQEVNLLFIYLLSCFSTELESLSVYTTLSGIEKKKLLFYFKCWWGISIQQDVFAPNLYNLECRVMLPRSGLVASEPVSVLHIASAARFKVWKIFGL